MRPGDDRAPPNPGAHGVTGRAGVSRARKMGTLLTSKLTCPGDPTHVESVFVTFRGRSPSRRREAGPGAPLSCASRKRPRGGPVAADPARAGDAGAPRGDGVRLVHDRAAGRARAE